jgi:hypothetical protein
MTSIPCALKCGSAYRRFAFVVGAGDHPGLVLELSSLDLAESFTSEEIATLDAAARLIQRLAELL